MSSRRSLGRRESVAADVTDPWGSLLATSVSATVRLVGTARGSDSGRNPSQRVRGERYLELIAHRAGVVLPRRQAGETFECTLRRGEMLLFLTPRFAAVPERGPQVGKRDPLPLHCNNECKRIVRDLYARFPQRLVSERIEGGSSHGSGPSFARVRFQGAHGYRGFVFNLRHQNDDLRALASLKGSRIGSIH